MTPKLTSSQKRAAIFVVVAMALLALWRIRIAVVSSGTPTVADVPQENNTKSGSKERPRVELNGADSLALMDVAGIGPAFAHRIIRYRELIGGYSDPEQLMNVYGITPEKYLPMESQVFADINSQAYKSLQTRWKAKKAKGHARPFAKSGANFRDDPSPKFQRHAFDSLPQAAKFPMESRTKEVRTVNINAADSLELLGLPGIGPSTAGRIIRFRDRIIFFKTVDQVGEVWGVRPENLEKMRPFLTVGNTDAFARVYINTWDVSHLGRHPYIGYKDAKILVAYREQHGPFKSMQDFRWVNGIDPSFPTKLEGYLQF